MTTTIGSKHTPSPSADTRRYDLYAGIHKAMRAAMTHTMLRLGSVDPGDHTDVAGSLADMQGLLALCRLHLHDENTFIPPAIERVAPGQSRRIADEHLDHERDIAALQAGIESVRTHADRAGPPLAALYRQLSVFVAHNFAHMADEETRHNAALWAGYDDRELLAIEHAIVASIPPDQMAAVLHWMLPALNHPQRQAMLEDMRDNAPAGAADGVMRMAESLLPAGEWRKLERALTVAA